MTETLGDLDQRTRSKLDELPPVAVIVYMELRNGTQPRTLKQLAYDTTRSRSSVHSALRQLHDAGLVSCEPRHRDPPTSEWEAIV